LSQPPSPDQDYPILKAAVIVMGVLFVLGFAGLVFALVMRSSDVAPAVAGDGDSSVALPLARFEGAIDKTIPLPANATDISADLQSGRLTVRFTEPGSPAVRVWIVHPVTGEVEASYLLSPDKSPQ